MKKKLLVLVLIPLLSAFQCEEDEFTPDYRIENANLVEIRDNKSAFAVGDYLFIETTIDNSQITTDSRSISLKDFMNGDPLVLYYSLVLYRLDSENEEVPIFIESVQAPDGMIEYSSENPFFNILSFYNGSNDNFTSSLGIKLSEPGVYALKPDVIIGNGNKHAILFTLNGSATQGSLELTTSIANSDEDGIYRFVVE
ncbi:MAG: hypothetical protein QNJ57_02170 [Flavobacteriaceae bacterium]|nr:hypothetical protein [Flavobacteriaceae bacterium]